MRRAWGRTALLQLRDDHDLGYGEIVPLSSMARVLATSEAFLGQLFVAVVLARIVGLQIATQQRAE